MLKKNLFKILLLSLAVLGQHCLAKPTNNEVVTQTAPVKDLCNIHSTFKALLEPSEKDELIPPSLQLLKIPLPKIIDIAIRYAEKAKTISDQVLKDEEFVKLDDNVEEVKDFKQKLQKYLEQFKKCEDIKELFENMDVYSDSTTAFFDQEKAGNLTANGKIILNVLKKYKTQELESEFEVEFNKFVKNFEATYENLKDAIKSENEKLEKKISEWYENFKTLKTFDEKVNAFEKFMDLYDME